MQRLSLVDETFDLNRTKEYNISILVSQDGFSFSILDDIRKKVVCLYHLDAYSHHAGLYLKRLKTVYDETDMLSPPYKETRIFYSAPEKTTIVPRQFFKPELAGDFYCITSETSKGCEIIYSFIPSMDSFAVFEIPLSLHSFLKEKHPETEVKNDLVLATKEPDSTNKVINVRLLKKHITITVLNESLNFYNSFYCETENDVLYYILGMAKLLKLEYDEVILDGIVNGQSGIYHRLKQYFRRVGMTVNNKNIHYSDSINRLPDSRFVNLFNSFVHE